VACAGGQACDTCGPREFKKAIGAFGFEALTIQSEHVIASASPTAFHKDPFDRLLIAQAISEPLQRITSDALLSEYSERVVLV
jgi:PIN domain nuclease of toxin-antitoxin system